MRHMIGKGYNFALDDFGSGMASFAYLHHLPAQYVKIDGDFVKRILSNATGSAIVEAVAKVAGTMDMMIIAESVEFDNLLPALRELGLDYVQGYALHRPEPLSDALSCHDGATLAEHLNESDKEVEVDRS
jgi:EAL domain-containing protein (putative c-di-GMP-specific phosphodiesterase class I)